MIRLLTNIDLDKLMHWFIVRAHKFRPRKYIYTIPDIYVCSVARAYFRIASFAFELSNLHEFRYATFDLWQFWENLNRTIRHFIRGKRVVSLEPTGILYNKQTRITWFPILHIFEAPPCNNLFDAISAYKI